MKKRILALAAAAALALTGCAALLERSYDVVEPYTNRYRDTGAEDTLRAESYQDLVNSLLMLVEDRAEVGIIRYYTDNAADAYQLFLSARHEVLKETVIGSYLLDGITFSFAGGEAYSAMTCTITYRQDALDPDNLISLSDTQSLVDLLRMAVRENHAMLTARFIDPVEHAAVESAVQELWQELCSDTADDTAQPDQSDQSAQSAAEAALPVQQEPSGGGEKASAGEPGEKASAGEPGEKAASEPPAEEEETLSVIYPPCPWQIVFYPDPDSAEIVEILLN